MNKLEQALIFFSLASTLFFWANAMSYYYRYLILHKFFEETASEKARARWTRDNNFWLFLRVFKSKPNTPPK